MLQTPFKSNRSDSLMADQLPNYTNNFLLPEQESGSSSSFSFKDFNKELNPFKGTLFQSHYQQLNKLKIDFYKQRNTIIEKTNLSQLNRQVINPFLKNQELQKRIKQHTQQIQVKSEQNQQIKEKIEEISQQQKKLDREKNIHAEIDTFLTSLKDKQKQQMPNFPNQKIILQDSLNIFKQNLSKRSQLTLDKLKPYLTYNSEIIKQNNLIYQQNNQNLKKQAQNYEQLLKQAKEKINFNIKRQEMYQIQDLIEDQQVFEQQIKKIQQRKKQDAQILKKKNILRD